MLIKAGKRHQRRFDTMVEADKWLYEMRHQDEYGDGIDAEDITVDEWFEFWHAELIKDLAANTRRNYDERYHKNIKSVIGRMKLKNVKPMHCTKILNSMDEEYAGSTIYQTYITLGMMFKSAKLNGKIRVHPLDGVKFSKSTKAVDDIYKRQQFWVAGPPKSMSSYRVIPLTSRAYEILKEVYATKDTRKQSPELDTVLEYADKRKDQKQKKSFNMQDLVFINFRTGMPNKNSSYDTHLYKLHDEAGSKRFCMHALRHTYATRAVESGLAAAE